MGGHSGHWYSRTQAGLGRAERLEELPLEELVEAAEPSDLTADRLPTPQHEVDSLQWYRTAAVPQGAVLGFSH